MKLKIWATVWAGMLMVSVASGADALTKWKAGNAAAYTKISAFLNEHSSFKNALAGAVDENLGALNACIPLLVDKDDKKLNEYFGKHVKEGKVIKALRENSTEVFKNFRELLRENLEPMKSLFQNKNALICLFTENDPANIAKAKVEKEKEEAKKAAATKKIEDKKKALEEKKAADAKKTEPKK